MAENMPDARENDALETYQLHNQSGVHGTKLKYNTHIDLSCQPVAKRLRTSLFYP